MTSRRSNWLSGIGLIGLASVLLSGCQALDVLSTHPSQVAELAAASSVSPSMNLADRVAVQTEENAKVHAGGPPSLDQLVQLAIEHHPELASAYTKAEMARGDFIQAGLCPNPTVAYIGEEFNNPDNPLGFQGAFVSQEIITAGKLRLAQTAAAHGLTVANWQALTKRYELITRVRQAYFEVLISQSELKANEQIVKLAQDGLDVAKTTERAGIGARSDVLRAEVELFQSNTRLVGAEERAGAAWKLLALAVGLPKLVPSTLAGALEDRPPGFEWREALATTLMRSSEIQAAQASVLEAEWKLRRQMVEPIPNLNVQGGPLYDFTTQALEANIQVSVNLPLFNKNQGGILAAQAQLAGAQQEALLVELRLAERLTQTYQRYQAARRQATIFQQDILPRATESLRLVQLGYRAGDPRFDYTAVLQAQQVLAQSKLAAIQAQGELWKAVTDIAGTVQLEHLEGPPGAR